MATASVIDVAERDFDVEVIERSHEVPVLVDFWAQWCGPCRVLGPVLEKEAEAAGGKFVLAKVDTDKAPSIAQRFRIQGIPAVKLFVGGKVVDEFVGALPAPQVRRFLEKAIPSEIDALVREAVTAREAGDAATARTKLDAALEAEPEHQLAHLELARLALADGDFDALAAHVDLVDLDGDLGDTARSMLAVADLARACAEAGGEQDCRHRVDRDPKDLAARYALAGCEVSAGHYREALDQLLAIVQVDKRWNDEAGRKGMLTVFDLVGRQSDLADEYVRQLQIYT
jgi:putative thioredoxin